MSYPPKLEPIPVKPLFFDAAWNYVEYPGRAVEEQSAEVGVRAEGKEQTAEGTKQTAEGKKKGWFGFSR